MSSFTCLTYHVIFSTKYRHRLLTLPIRPRLYEYMGGTIRSLKGTLVEIGGVADHVHLLMHLPATIAVSDSIRDIKANASKWLNELPESPGRFEWQKGYAAFTVSMSLRGSVQTYIRNEEEHHRTQTFQEEYELFLRKHGIEFRPEFLFEGEYTG